MSAALRFIPFPPGQGQGRARDAAIKLIVPQGVPSSQLPTRRPMRFANNPTLVAKQAAIALAAQAAIGLPTIGNATLGVDYTITTTSGKRFINFLATGKTMTLTTDRAMVVDYFAIGGGGAGGAIYAGGGGAGGLQTATNHSLAAGTYNVVIGAGGIGLQGSGPNGANTTFGGIVTALGGGGGATSSNNNGANGGCGGGGSYQYSSGGVGSQGFNGGGGNPSGGGGGIGGVGGNGEALAVGGLGLIFNGIQYGGGGGGQTFEAVPPLAVFRAGIGGQRGPGIAAKGGDAQANSGSGGGGSSHNGTIFPNGGNGGSGIFILAIPDISIGNAILGLDYTITTNGSKTFYNFLATGKTMTFNANKALTVDYLTLGGGGSGGGNFAGGGGAGGLQQATNVSLATGSYTIVIGAGGAAVGRANVVGNNGSNTIFGSIATAFGGGGGSHDSTNALSGGCGGGGGTRGSGLNGGIGSQGFNGRPGDPAGMSFGGGGGGIGAIGNGFVGGAGISFNNGTLLQIGGGGQGSQDVTTAPPAGIFGGGRGGTRNADATAGTPNTGGGGGGRGDNQSNSNGSGAGGSGICIVAVDTTTPSYFYTGADQTFIVPTGVTSLKVSLWGAGGGGRSGLRGGAGAFVSGNLGVTPGETLTLIVGEGGKFALAGSGRSYGGGGAGGNNGQLALNSQGGGRSAIRRGALDIVTAGAGGGGRNGRGGRGGLTTGEEGLFSGGRGGTQTAGGTLPGGSASGSLNLGGNNVQDNGAGGGSGFFGGGGGIQDRNGGGGSSLFSNLTGFVGEESSDGATAPGRVSPFYAANAATGGNNETTGQAGHGLITIEYETPITVPRNPMLYSYIRNGTDSKAFVGSTQNGTSWSFIDTGTTMTATDHTWGKHYISGKPDGSKLVITGFITPGMMVSTDNGLTWTPVANMPDTIVIAPALWTGTRWLFGRGSIHAMDDNQQNITTVLSGTGGNMFDLKRNPNTGTILALGGQSSTNFIWRSTDGGTSWTQTGTGIMSDYLRGAAYSPTLNIWVAYGTGGMSNSTNDGLTWSARNNLVGQYESLVWIAEDNLFVSASINGESGFRTSVDGVNWSDLVSPTGTSGFWAIIKFNNKYFARMIINGVICLGEATALTGPWTQVTTPGIAPQRSQGFFISS